MTNTTLPSLPVTQSKPATDAPTNCAVSTGSLLLAEAGVKIGDKVNWVPRFPIIGAGKRRVMTVKGIHIGTHEINRGQPAIHVVGENGEGFRAYPGEIVLANGSHEPCPAKTKE